MITSRGSLEEWRAVPDWPDYAVSSLGRVRRTVAGGSWPAGRFVKPVLNGLNRTYFYVRLCRPDKRQTLRLHGLVAAAFIGPRPEGLHINHKDGNRHNNVAANLEYVTRRQIEDHAVANALHAWGEKHGMNKLTEDQVREIRRIAGSDTDAAIGARFGVTKSTILAIRRGMTWRHLV